MISRGNATIMATEYRDRKRSLRAKRVKYVKERHNRDYFLTAVRVEEDMLFGVQFITKDGD